MSNIGDQARLPTDRPPDIRAMDGFPKTKTILWDKTAVGKPTFLHLSYYRKSRVCIPEKILKLVQHQCENYGQKNHTLIGSLIVEDDGEAVQFQVDRLDTRPIMSADISTNLAPGDLLIPLEVTNNTAGKRRGSVEDFVTALKRLQERCCSKSSIDLSNFVLLRGWVSFYSNAHSSVAHMDFDMVTMGTVFKATPIANVPIVLTALSKNLAGPMSLSHTQGTPKSGYLTMDHTRKLLLVLESDPKAGTLPIVGIWVSGVDFVQHSFIWAACLRYIHNTHLQDRVCAPPEEFLLVLYSPLHTRPEFYQCVTTCGENKLMYELYCGHEVCNHTKSLSSQNDDFTEVELNSEQNGDERALFDAALAKHSTHVYDGHSEKRWTDDINPRSIPTPHAEMLPVIKPMVPDVSILWTDSPNNSALPPPQPPAVMPIMASPHSVSNGSSTPFSTASNNRTPQYINSYRQLNTAHQVLPRAQSHSQPFAVSSACENPQLVAASMPRTGIPISHPYVSTVHQQRFPSFQHPSSSSIFNNSVTSINSQNISYSPYHNVSRNALPSDYVSNKNTSPMFHTQNQTVSYTSNGSSPSYVNNRPLHQGICSTADPVHMPPATFNTKKLPNEMVLSTQGQNIHATSQSASHQQFAVPGRLPSTTQSLTALPPAPVVLAKSVLNSAPQWQNNQLVQRQASSYNNESSQSNDTSSESLPNARNHFAMVNTLKTVVEETSSNSSSSSSTTCGCKCQAEKNISLSNASNFSSQNGAAGSNQSVAYNTTKSSDDDSGLSVTPERPNSSPPPLAPPQPHALESSVVSTTNNSSLSRDNCSSAFGDAMNNVNWDHVPPEIKCLLIQQNEQLKLLQQQIQMLMLNQSSQSPKSLSSAACDTVPASNQPLPPQSSSSSSNSRVSCSVAVNTSFTGDHHHHHQHANGLPSAEFGFAGVHPHGATSSSDLQQHEDLACHNSVPLQNDPCSNALDEANTSSVSNRLSSSSKSLSPRIQNDFDKSVIEGNSSASSDHSRDSVTSANATGMLQMDVSRSQGEQSYPNDSDFYNNCQDESYSTVAEEATDPRQFYDQIMNNINMFLTNGEDDSSEQPDKDEYLASTLHDSTTKFPEGTGSANSTLFPHINYMSMMLGGSSETGQSMEINAMAMKYLKDDQLTQMAMMLKQNGGSEDHNTNNKLLQRMINSGSASCRSSSSNKQSSSADVSRLGISPNNLTIGTRNYLEKHGLLGQDSQCFNDNLDVLDHTFKLKTDFSVAMTDTDKSYARSLQTSPVKKYVQSPLTGPTHNAGDDVRNNIGYKQKNYPKDLGASPVLLPPKHYNMTQQSPAQRAVDTNPSNDRGAFFDDEDDGENILDIAKLKQLPKLL